MNNNLTTKSKVEILINTLEKEKDLLIPWLQRKEIAAWSAVLFYIAILWAFLQFLNNSKNFINDNAYLFIFLLILILGGWIIFFRFIHSQYASIYDWNARSIVLRDIIFELIEKEDRFFELNNVKLSNLNEYIRNQIKDMKINEVQKFIGKNHPLKIFIYFWFLWLIKLFSKVFNKKINKESLTNFERQEASIYSLLSLITLFTIYLLYRILN